MSPDANASRLTLRRVLSSAEPDFDALVQIYTEAHPVSELKPAAELRQMIERPEYFFLAMMQDLSVAAFSISICFPDSDAALLEYMAVAVAKRNHGIGGLLFKETTEFPPIAGRYLLIEVDSDKCRSGDRQDRVRRKSFYRRLGCLEIGGLSYIMPRVSSATPPPMEMLIYRSTLPDFVVRSRLRRWLGNCYSQVYHAPSDDPRIDLMVEHLPLEVPLI